MQFKLKIIDSDSKTHAFSHLIFTSNYLFNIQVNSPCADAVSPQFCKCFPLKLENFQQNGKQNTSTLKKIIIIQKNNPSKPQLPECNFIKISKKQGIIYYRFESLKISIFLVSIFKWERVKEKPCLKKRTFSQFEKSKMLCFVICERSSSRHNIIW